jgi:hypothetical protein
LASLGLQLPCGSTSPTEARWVCRRHRLGREMREKLVRVGGIEVAIDEAQSWLRTYLDAERNRMAIKPHPYPAYDR